MAKKQTATKNYDVTGLSIRDIMDIDLDVFNKLSERELRQITSRLVSASNKRIRSFEKKGIESPAVRNLGMKNKFSIKFPKGMKNTRGKVISEFARARNFLTGKTSTLSGYKEYLKNVREEVETAVGRPVTAGEIGKAFSILHKMQEQGLVDGKRGSKGSLQAREMIFDILSENPNLDEDDIIEKVTNEYENFYEEYEE